MTQPPPWRPTPSTTARRSGFGKKQEGGGCLVVGIGLFALVCVVAGAIALVFFLKARRSTAIDDRPAVTTPSGSARRPPRPPVKRD
jgi:hypothetical protein